MTAQAVGTSATAARARPLARWWVVLAAVLVGVLLAASGALVVVREDRRLADLEALGTATDRVTAAIGELAGPMSEAQSTLDQSAGRVDDERARSELAAALVTARAAVHARAADPAELDAIAARLASVRGELVAATGVVTSAVASWDLAQARAAWVQAHAQLDEAVSAAEAVLDSSAGRVADDSVRQALGSALDSARTIRDAPEASTASALRTDATALSAAVESLTASQAAVAAAVESWVQAQKAAAEAAAASAAARTAQHQSTPKKTSPQAPASPSPSATSESHWETTVTYEELRICGDTEGNSWEC